MCDNEPSTKSLQDSAIRSLAGVEVIPQGPPEGDHKANGREEMAVREVKRQCRTLRISAVQNTGVRIADDSPLLSWLPRLRSARHEQNAKWHRREDERNEANWTKMEKHKSTRHEARGTRHEARGTRHEHRPALVDRIRSAHNFSQVSLDTCFVSTSATFSALCTVIRRTRPKATHDWYGQESNFQRLAVLSRTLVPPETRVFPALPQVHEQKMQSFKIKKLICNTEETTMEVWPNKQHLTAKKMAKTSSRLKPRFILSPERTRMTRTTGKNMGRRYQ